MRVTFLFFSLIFVNTTFSQTIPVFQVLYAEKASLSNGTILKSLDLLLDETIHVADSGYLVLIHKAGVPIEFNSDTIIDLRNLHLTLTRPIIIKHKKKEKILKVLSSSSYQSSVGLDYLFLRTESEAQNSVKENYPPVHDGVRNGKLKYPPLIDSRIYYDDDVKVVFQTGTLTNDRDEPIDFVVKVTNVFDEVLASFSQKKGEEFIIPKIELDKFIEGEEFVILYIEDNNGREIVSPLMLSSFPKRGIKFPFSKEIKSPAAALMAGYFYEMYSYDASKEALPYYELATQLSDKQFYKDMLSNYLKRTGQ
jgi:hypothetical protein